MVPPLVQPAFKGRLSLHKGLRPGGIACHCASKPLSHAKPLEAPRHGWLQGCYKWEALPSTLTGRLQDVLPAPDLAVLLLAGCRKHLIMFRM